MQPQDHSLKSPSESFSFCEWPSKCVLVCVSAKTFDFCQTEPEMSRPGSDWRVIFSVIELFTWLIEVGEDDSEPYEGARIVWSAKFEPHQDETDNGEIHRTEGRKSTTRFDVQKDDIQAVVPISKVKCFRSVYFQPILVRPRFICMFTMCAQMAR
jgi:hypothetical protein